MKQMKSMNKQGKDVYPNDSITSKQMEEYMKWKGKMP